MQYIGRLFKHVWPQWHRVTVILVCAVCIGVFYALTFLTVVPILKVMLSQEGIHGYVDRKVCKDRYGVDFFAPSQVDFSDPKAAYHLLVAGVESKTAAEQAGLAEQDFIVGVGDSSDDDGSYQKPSRELLRLLAQAPADSNLPVRSKRQGDDGQIVTGITTLETGSGASRQMALLQRVVSFVPREHSARGKMIAMKWIIGLLVLFTLGRCIALFLQKYLAAKVTETAIAEVRQEMFGHVVQMPVAHFDSEKPSDAVSRLIGDTNQLAIGVKILLGKTLREPIKAIALLGTAMFMDAKLTLIFLGSAPPTIYAVSQLGRKIKRFTKKRLVSSSLMLGKLNESFESVKVVKVYNQQDYEQQKFLCLNQRLVKQALRIAKISAGTSPIMEVIGIGAGSAALLFGVHWVTAGGLDTSEFLALVMLLGGAAESVRKSSDIWNKVQQGNAAGARVYGLLDQSREAERIDAVELPRLRRGIEFRDVAFSYPQADRPVLNKLNLSIEAGQNIAIVGPNGSGKTTLVNLLPRFYDPGSGAVLIDGQDIRDFTLHSLRAQIGMVTQRVVTFNDTIAANIAYGKNNATTAEIVAAAERAHAHEFISQLPDGYDTIIGEQGTGLSGGQLQRIVIARAIIKDPPILIFDEATSQVDAESEAKIHAAVEEIMHERTSFVIAHRFSTILSADLIVVMDNGQIVAKGHHDELIAKSALYQNLYENQLVKA